MENGLIARLSTTHFGEILCCNFAVSLRGTSETVAFRAMHQRSTPFVGIYKSLDVLTLLAGRTRSTDNSRSCHHVERDTELAAPDLSARDR